MEQVDMDLTRALEDELPAMRGSLYNRDYEMATHLGPRTCIED